MSSFIREVQRTARSLARSPLFTVISVVTLAVELGVRMALGAPAGARRAAAVYPAIALRTE